MTAIVVQRFDGQMEDIPFQKNIAWYTEPKSCFTILASYILEVLCGALRFSYIALECHLLFYKNSFKLATEARIAINIELTSSLETRVFEM